MSEQEATTRCESVDLAGLDEPREDAGVIGEATAGDVPEDESVGEPGGDEWEDAAAGEVQVGSASPASEEPSTAAGSGDDPVGIPRYYSSLDDFVQNYIARVYERRIGVGRAWCESWWMHDEAVARLSALWDMWEYLRVTEPVTGMATWYTSYGDPMMRELMDENGCFTGCSEDRGHRMKRPHEDARLPCAPAPFGLFERY